MKYITHKRFKTKAICGEVNIPALTPCHCDENGIIYYQEHHLCFIKSENAHQHFAIDEDSKGLERGQLTQSIQKILAKIDNKKQEKWNRVWEDPICQKFKRIEYEDYWLWNHDFFEADINTLTYIYNLIKGVKANA